jgi:glutamine cyclotransferase
MPFFKNILSTLFPTVMLCMVLACNCNPEVPGITTSRIENNSVFIPASPGYRIVAEFPHDTGAYTQGLFWHDGYLFEGTGKEGESNIRRVELESGKVLNQAMNAKEIFGEGITLLNGKIYQITWKNQKGFVYDAVSLKQTGEFAINTQGWGLTTDGTDLIYSDGSSNLYFLDTATFREKKRIGVTDNFGPVSNLNELEWINGKVWANRYQTDFIYEIDPESGRVLTRVDFSGLKQQSGFSVEDPLDQCLNGIAFDSVGKRIFITGKYWPKLFEVKIGE